MFYSPCHERSNPRPNQNDFDSTHPCDTELHKVGKHQSVDAAVSLQNRLLLLWH